MDVRRIGRLAGDLDRFLRLFDDCFARSEGREHLRRYVRGQLSNVRRKCVDMCVANSQTFAASASSRWLTLWAWRQERCRIF